MEGCGENFYDHWNRFNDSHWIKSHWMSNTTKMINTWSFRNVNIDDDTLYLQIALGRPGSHPYSSGEISTLRYYCYGRFTSNAKISPACGTISSPIFLYLDTGPDGKRNMILTLKFILMFLI